MATAQLKVKVLNARKLQNKETFQTSDPYCMLELGSKSFKTKHISSNLNPDWNEEFVFEVQDNDDVIALSIWDKNAIKKDFFMGYSFVSFHDCRKNQDTPKCLELLGGLKGQINLVLNPNFETSVSTIERLEILVKETVPDEKSAEEAKRLQAEVDRISADNEKLSKEIGEEKLKVEQAKYTEKELQDAVNKLKAGHQAGGDQAQNEIEELKRMNKESADKGRQLLVEIQELEEKKRQCDEEETQLKNKIKELSEKHHVSDTEVIRLTAELNKMAEERSNQKEDEIKTLQEKIEKCETESKQMSADMDALQGRNIGLEETNKSMNNDNSSCQEENNKLRREKEILREEVERKGQEINDLKNEKSEEVENGDKWHAVELHGLEQEVKRLVAEIDKIAEENTKLEEKNNNASSESEQFERQAAQLESEINELRKKNKELEKDVMRLDVAASEIVGVETEQVVESGMDWGPDTKELEETIKMLEEENKDLSESNTKLETDVDQLGSESKKIENEKKKIEEACKELADGNTSLQNKNEKLEEDVTRRSAEIEQLAKSCKNLEGAKGSKGNGKEMAEKVRYLTVQNNALKIHTEMLEAETERNKYFFYCSTILLIGLSVALILKW